MSYTEVFVWGDDSQGQLGLSQFQQDNTPPRYCSFGVIIGKLSCGKNHSGFITNSGQLYTMGSNQYGKLGLGNQELQNTNAPCLVENISDPVLDISCGFFSTGIVMNDGQLMMAGLPTLLGSKVQQISQSFQNIHNEELFQQISVGKRHCGAVTQSGWLFTWGFGDNGELGNGVNLYQQTPKRVSISDKVKQVSCGIEFSLIITQRGKVYSCGRNDKGQLGIGEYQNYAWFTLVKSLRNITKVTAGNCAIALDKKHKAYIWGSGTFGEFKTPVIISNQSDIIDISTSGNSLGFINRQGQAFTWGINNKGQLGHQNASRYTVPTLLTPLINKRIKYIAFGKNHCIALGDNIKKLNIALQQKQDIDLQNLQINSTSRTKRQKSFKKLQKQPLTVRNNDNKLFDLQSKPLMKEGTLNLSTIEGNQNYQTFMDKISYLKQEQEYNLNQIQRLQINLNQESSLRLFYENELTKYQNKYGQYEQLYQEKCQLQQLLKEQDESLVNLSQMIEEYENQMIKLQKQNEKQRDTIEHLQKENIQLKRNRHKSPDSLQDNSLVQMSRSFDKDSISGPIFSLSPLRSPKWDKDKDAVQPRTPPTFRDGMSVNSTQAKNSLNDIKQRLQNLHKDKSNLESRLMKFGKKLQL